MLKGWLVLELILARRARVKDTVVGGVVAKFGVNKRVDTSKDIEVDVERLGELSRVEGNPCLDVEVAKRLGEGLNTEAGLAVA